MDWAYMDGGKGINLANFISAVGPHGGPIGRQELAHSGVGQMRKPWLPAHPSGLVYSV